MEQVEFAKTRKKFSKNISANLFTKVKSALASAFAAPRLSLALA